MKTNYFLVLPAAGFLESSFFLGVVPSALGQTNLTLLKNSSGATEFIADGVIPMGGVVRASDGRLHGTTAAFYRFRLK